VGVAAPVLASVKIAKNAQLVVVIKFINFGMKVALSSKNLLYDLQSLCNKMSQTRSTINS